MDHYILEIDVQVSLVLTLIDSHTGDPPLGYTTVYLEDMFRKPVKKNDGHYVFTDLPQSSYKVWIKAEYYLDEFVEVSLSESEGDYPHIFVSLKPRAHYPFRAGTTLVRAALRDCYGYPLEGKATAMVLTEECFRARLAENVNQGGAQLSLAQVSARIAIGDKLLIKNKENKKVEECTIIDHEYGSKDYSLVEPLCYEHPRGTMLLPVVETVSDERGEIVIPFRNYSMKNFLVEVIFSSNNQEVVKEVSLQEGMQDYLGFIQL